MVKRQQIKLERKAKNLNLHDEILWLIGAPTHIFVHKKGKLAKLRIKNKPSEAWTREIQEGLKVIRGVEVHRATIHRHIQQHKTEKSLWEVKKGFYRLTEEGQERFMEIEETNRAEFDAKRSGRRNSVKVNFGPEIDGERKWIAIHVFTYNQAFVQLMERELIKYAKAEEKTVRNMRFEGDFPEVAELGAMVKNVLYALVRMRNAFDRNEKLRFGKRVNNLLKSSPDVRKLLNFINLRDL